MCDLCKANGGTPPDRFRNGKLLCNGHTKTFGKSLKHGRRSARSTLCGNFPMPASTKCRVHGGNSPAGPASPSFKHGRYSKLLPTRLAGRFQEAAADPTILELQDEIALIDVRLGELLARIDTGESGAVWSDMRDAMRDFIAALGRRDTARLKDPLRRMEELIHKGVEDYKVWEEVFQVVDHRRKLVESERKRMVELQQMITTDRAMVLLAVVVDTIRKHVPDAGTVRAIGADLRSLVAGASSRPA